MSDLVPKTVSAGDTVSYETKSAFSTYRIWGLLVLATTLCIDKAVETGRLPAVLRDDALGTVLEFLGYAGGFAMTLYGSWLAKRPLSLTGGTVTEPKKVN